MALGAGAIPIAAAGGPAAADTTFVVNTGQDVDSGSCDPAPGDCSLRDAITAANNTAGADTVEFDLGAGSVTIVLDIAGLGPLPTITDQLTIDGSAADLTIDAGQAGRIFDATAPLTVKSLALVNGFVTDEHGGAIRASAAVTLEDCAFTDNTVVGATTISQGGAVFSTTSVRATDCDFEDNAVAATSPGGGGGAIRATSVTVGGASDLTGNTTMNGNGTGGAIRAGTVTVGPGARFHDNRTQQAGGAIYQEAGGGSVTIDGAAFTSNDSTNNRGGAVLSAGTLSISNSTFGGPDAADGNTADVAGGAIAIFDGTATITTSTFERNRSIGASPGGAIWSSTDDLPGVSITDSTFRMNRAEGDGGAIFLDESELHVEGSTFEQNLTAGSGGDDGGAIHFGQAGGASSAGTVTNSTFDANTALDSGGAISVETDGAKTVRLRNSTFDANTATGGGGGSALYQGSGELRAANSIVRGTDGPLCSGSLVDDGYNLSFLNPAGTGGGCPETGTSTVAEPFLGPLTDNGGPTQTMAPGDGSPAIDAITDSVACPPPATDQRGVARPVLPHCDIGAVELDYRPDGLIKRPKKPFRGAGIFNDTGAGQTYQQKKPSGAVATFKVRVRSNAQFLADTIIVTGPAGTKKFKVKYLDGSIDVTGAVTGGGYLADLAPGESTVLTLKVKVTAKAKPGNQRATLVTMLSEEDSSKLDAVKAVTKGK